MKIFFQKTQKALCHTVIFLTAILFAACSQDGSPVNRTAALQTKATQTGFYINNGKLYDANDNLFVMRGVNHAHTWYKSYLETAITAIKAHNSNAVRIVLSNGTHPEWGNGTKDDIDSVRNVISLCKENKMIAVLEIHDATGSNEFTMLDQAADYWIEMKDALIGEEEYVIINIANEWYGQWDSTAWADGYKTVIPKLRNAGLTHTFIVDAAGWGQYAASVPEKGQEIFATDPLANTMFAIHMYEYAGGTPEMVRSNIDNTLAEGLALVIGEFGHQHTDGDVAEQEILDYCQLTDVSWLAWSWKGNSGGVEYLDLSNDWAGQDLTDWGNTAFNGSNGIEQTSIECSIFGTTVINRPPAVNAGADQNITELTTTLSGEATDDGKPNNTLTVLWSKVSGPGTVTFSNDTSLITDVTFSDHGLYVLQLTASDGEKSTSDTVTINSDENLYIPITLPFEQNGKGEFYWQFDADVFNSYDNNINSWSTDLILINGVDCTNKYLNFTMMPEPINGTYQIYYKGLYDWSHFHVH